MITSKKRCHRVNSVWWTIAAVVTLAMLAAAIRSTWTEPTAMACLIYALAAAVFLLAQLVGFVVSQTYYSDSLEDVKFDVIENEEAEWKD